MHRHRRPPVCSPGSALPLAAFVTGCLSLAWPAPALASPDSADLEEEAPLPEVYNGVPVEECAWPTVVAVVGGGLCTGTLIHPQLVVYAAHCGGGQKSLRFSTSSSGGGFSVIGDCTTYPDYNSVSDVGEDWAFCKLNSSVNVPITPAMHGCEMDFLQPGVEVALIGFGGAHNGGAGTKRWALTPLSAINRANNASSVGLGEGDASICPGDSGGPAMLQFEDGSWHAFGIASTLATTCGSKGDHSLITGAIPWIEETSGIDVTPCHDADGNWDPGPSCGDFHMAGATPYGSYSDGCVGEAPISGDSASCGPPRGTPVETTPPTVTLVNPVDGTEVEPDSLVAFNIDADDGDGWGVTRVTLEVDGVVLDETWDTLPPWGFTGAKFPEGVFTIRAVAEDPWQNRGFSEPIELYVGVDAPVTPAEDSGAGEDDGGTSGTSAGGDAASEGCGCNAAPTPAAPLHTSLALLALLGLRTRPRRWAGFRS